MVRASNHWRFKPGSFDSLHFNQIFESGNKYNIPYLKKGNVIDCDFIPVNRVLHGNGKGIHCFVEDYYLERFWKRPEVYIKYLKNAKCFFTPDFSLYIDMPLSMQIWNTYRNRWIGRYFQDNRVNVIPSISWSDERSYEFCFSGVEIGSIVAISTVGAYRTDNSLFKEGFEQMVEVVRPKLIYVYGEETIDATQITQINIPPFHKQMRERIKQKLNRGMNCV